MKLWKIVGAATLLASGLIGTASAKDLIIGMMCDRTGATAVTGTVLCPGYHDYVNLVNSKGGIQGHQIKALEIDIEYKVPQAVEAYQRYKAEGAVLISPWGTPMAYALIQSMAEDKLPATSAGFGSAAAGNGERYPYMFPIAASYWSQTAATVDFVKKQLGGNMKGKKIAYIYYDNPAGREGIPVMEKLQKIEGYELRTFAVPPPGVEMNAQILDITRRFKADFVISHLFGPAPAVSIKEFKRAGYPLNKVIGLVWAVSEGDIEAAGGMAVADGYYTVQFAGVGSTYPVHNEIREMYQKAGKPPPKEMALSVYYNRGVFQAAIHIEAISNAVKAKGGPNITGEDVRNGFYQIKDFSLGGLVPPLHITKQDHEGGGWVRVFQIKDGKYVAQTDWFRAYRDVVKELLVAEEKKN